MSDGFEVNRSIMIEAPVKEGTFVSSSGEDGVKQPHDLHERTG